MVVQFVFALKIVTADGPVMAKSLPSIAAELHMISLLNLMFNFFGLQPPGITDVIAENGYTSNVRVSLGRFLPQISVSVFPSLPVCKLML